MKKLLFGLGTASAAIAPIVTVVACGDKKDEGKKGAAAKTPDQGKTGGGAHVPIMDIVKLKAEFIRQNPGLTEEEKRAVNAFNTLDELGTYANGLARADRVINIPGVGPINGQTKGKYNQAEVATKKREYLQNINDMLALAQPGSDLLYIKSKQGTFLKVVMVVMQAQTALINKATTMSALKTAHSTAIAAINKVAKEQKAVAEGLRTAVSSAKQVALTELEKAKNAFNTLSDSSKVIDAYDFWVVKIMNLATTTTVDVYNKFKTDGVAAINAAGQKQLGLEGIDAVRRTAKASIEAAKNKAMGSDFVDGPRVKFLDDFNAFVSNQKATLNTKLNVADIQTAAAAATKLINSKIAEVKQRLKDDKVIAQLVAIAQTELNGYAGSSGIDAIQDPIIKDKILKVLNVQKGYLADGTSHGSGDTLIWIKEHATQSDIEAAKAVVKKIVVAFAEIQGITLT